MPSPSGERWKRDTSKGKMCTVTAHALAIGVSQSHNRVTGHAQPATIALGDLLEDKCVEMFVIQLPQSKREQQVRAAQVYVPSFDWLSRLPSILPPVQAE